MPSEKAKKNGLTLMEVFGFLEKNPALRAANPHLRLVQQPPEIEQNAAKSPVSTPSKGQDTPKAKKRGKKRREMNATEREFSRYLQKQVQDGQLTCFDYEAITLRWGDSGSELSYTPDFAAQVVEPSSPNAKPAIRFIFFEVKGAHAWQKDIVRFKAARNHFVNFEFQLWEKGKAGWQNTI